MVDTHAILERLPDYRDRLHEMRETILANLVMVGEIPAPTFQEQDRVKFLQDRFTENGLQNVSTDEVGNAVGIHPGSDGGGNILAVAHVDTVFSETADHSVTVEADHAMGVGIGDNALGLAALVSLPRILEHLGLQLQSNLILLGAVRSQGRGDLEGIRFFLENSTVPIFAGVSVEAMQLGRLSYTSIGMLRGEITCQVPEEYDWTRFGAFSAIQSLNDVIDKLMSIPLPRKPRSSIVLGSIRGGHAYESVATEAVLRFEIRSESEEITDEVRERIENICAEVSTQTGADVSVDFFARRKPGGLEFSHPLAAFGREAFKALGIEPRVSSTLSEVTAFTDRGIPALRLAITRGESFKSGRDRLEIEPIFAGIAQLVGVLEAIDGGLCNDNG
jgi:acetylornithine deacetylase/succinyl-diaminopimelate desuccinylase-like protein